MDLLERPRHTDPPASPPTSSLADLLSLVHTKQAKYNCSCGIVRDSNPCNCSRCHRILRDDKSPCPFYGRCVEPLAWNIESELVRTQNQSPLFIVLPKEIRDIIFEYALTGYKTQSFGSILGRDVSRHLFSPKSTKTPDIATNLLRTCRAVYIETWSLPLSLNPYIVYNLQFSARAGITIHKLLPWQFALIQRLDITLQQVALEGGALVDFLFRKERWRSLERSHGCYAIPSQCKQGNLSSVITKTYLERYFESDKICKSFDFALLSSNSNEPRQFLSHLIGEGTTHDEKFFPWFSGMRVMKARPLTHLTLRLSRDDWWTWTDRPDLTDPLCHLGLDPSVGNGRVASDSRATASCMRALAEQRRAGHHPEISDTQGWSHAIAQLRDLKCLELVLETFQEKRGQLEAVVEAAKTWKFPLYETQRELVWDGEVQMTSWNSQGSSIPVEPGFHRRSDWYKDCRDFDVRLVRFVKRRVQ